MILTFGLKDGRNCYFDVEDLSVTEDELVFDEVILYINDEPYDGSSETWAGHKMSDDDIFEQVVNAYIRNDSTDYTGFGNDWSVFDPILSNIEYDNGSNIAITLPVVEFNEIVVYELNMATTGFRFYNYDDEFLVLDSNGGVVTDYESFYASAIFEEYEYIMNGKTECLYITPDVEEYLSEEYEEYDD